MLKQILLFILTTLSAFSSSVNVSIINPTVKKLPFTIEANAVVVSKNKFSITAKTSGIIHLKTFQNSVVSKNEIIATISNVPRDEKLHSLHKILNLQKQELNSFKLKLQIIKEKYTIGVGSKNSYLDEKIAYEQLRELHNTTQNEYNTFLLEQKNSIIKVVKQGIITNLVADNSYINYGSNIATLIDNDNLVKLFVDSSYAAKIQKDMQVQLFSSYENCNAKVINILQKTSNNLVEVIVKPNVKLPLNLQLSAKIVLKQLHGTLIPKEAIVLRDNHPAIYLIDKQNIAHIFFIEIRKDMLNNALIKNTLPKNAKVALKNAYMLYDNLEVSVK